MNPLPSAASGHLSTAPAKAVQQTGRSLQSATNGRIRRAARDFESILIEHMLRTARSSGSQKGLFPSSNGAEIQRGMADEQFAKAIAQGGGIGLGDLLAQNLTRTQGGNPGSSSGRPRSIPGAETVRNLGSRR